MLLAGANRDLVCNALLITKRAIRKWINRFNRCGVDGLIVKKRPGTMTIINGQQAMELTDLNEEKLLERLDQAILDVINNPKKTQKTARIGTLI